MQMYLDWKEDDEGNRHSFSLMELSDVELQTISNALQQWKDATDLILARKASGNDPGALHTVAQEKQRASFMLNLIKKSQHNERT